MRTSPGWHAIAGLLLIVPACKGQGESGGVFEKYVASLDAHMLEYCSCLFEQGYWSSTEACVEDYLETFDRRDPAQLECLEEAVATSRTLATYYECAASAYEDYTRCWQALGACQPFTCENGDSILPYLACDGSNDCGDGSDESNCPEPFTCDGGETLMDFLVCDGVAHCDDGSDEMNCEPNRLLCYRAFSDAITACPAMTEADEAAVANCGWGDADEKSSGSHVTQGDWIFESRGETSRVPGEESGASTNDTPRASEASYISVDPRIHALALRQQVDASPSASLRRAIQRDVPRSRRR